MFALEMKTKFRPPPFYEVSALDLNYITLFFISSAIKIDGKISFTINSKAIQKLEFILSITVNLASFVLMHENNFYLI